MIKQFKWHRHSHNSLCGERALGDVLSTLLTRYDGDVDKLNAHLQRLPQRQPIYGKPEPFRGYAAERAVRGVDGLWYISHTPILSLRADDDELDAWVVTCPHCGDQNVVIHEPHIDEHECTTWRSGWTGQGAYLKCTEGHWFRAEYVECEPHHLPRGADDWYYREIEFHREHRDWDGLLPADLIEKGFHLDTPNTTNDLVKETRGRSEPRYTEIWDEPKATKSATVQNRPPLRDRLRQGLWYTLADQLQYATACELCVDDWGYPVLNIDTFVGSSVIHFAKACKHNDDFYYPPVPYPMRERAALWADKISEAEVAHTALYDLTNPSAFASLLEELKGNYPKWDDEASDTYDDALEALKAYMTFIKTNVPMNQWPLPTTWVVFDTLLCSVLRAFCEAHAEF